MKKIYSSFFTIIFFLISSASISADFKKGYDALLKGDYKSAFVEFQKLAKDGDIISMYNLGRMYQNGLGVDRDFEKAMKLYLTSAKEGYSLSYNNIGQMYSLGQGVEKDHKVSMNWYKLGVKYKLSDSAYNIGTKFINGSGVEKNYSVALMWMNIALKLDNFSSSKVKFKIEKIREKLVDFMSQVQQEKSVLLTRQCIIKNYIGC